MTVSLSTEKESASGTTSSDVVVEAVRLQEEKENSGMCTGALRLFSTEQAEAIEMVKVL